MTRPPRRTPLPPRSLDERGTSAVEYGLLVILIAVVITVALGVLGVDLSDIIDAIARTIGG
ncbi:MAG: Flp family type IVb pilin [Actinobacteria bacterium]|nr:Flp family type IVb pilin [Actinomycetota bacterium]